MENHSELSCSRRTFTKAVAVGAGASLLPRTASAQGDDKPLFKISVAEWSLNKLLFGGKLDNLEFAAYCKDNFGIYFLWCYFLIDT